MSTRSPSPFWNGFVGQRAISVKHRADWSANRWRWSGWVTTTTLSPTRPRPTSSAARSRVLAGMLAILNMSPLSMFGHVGILVTTVPSIYSDEVDCVNAAANCDEFDACAPRFVPDDEIDQLPRAEVYGPITAKGTLRSNARRIREPSTRSRSIARSRTRPASKGFAEKETLMLIAKPARRPVPGTPPRTATAPARSSAMPCRARWRRQACCQLGR